MFKLIINSHKKTATLYNIEYPETILVKTVTILAQIKNFDNFPLTKTLQDILDSISH